MTLAEEGVRAIEASAGAWYVKWSAEPAAEVPAGVVTVTSTRPAASAGDRAVIEVDELTVNDGAGTPPN